MTVDHDLDDRYNIASGQLLQRSLKLPHAMMISPVVISPMVVVAMIVGIAAKPAASRITRRFGHVGKPP